MKATNINCIFYVVLAEAIDILGAFFLVSCNRVHLLSFFNHIEKFSGFVKAPSLCLKYAIGNNS